MKEFECSNCHVREAEIIKCSKCWKYICTACAVSGLCFDCFAKARLKKEVDNYFSDKYGLFA